MNQHPLEQLLAEGHLDPTHQADIDQLLAQSTEDDTPWYIRVAVGLSGWVAACFLLGFVMVGLGTILLMSESGVPLIVCGIIFCGMMIVVKRTFPTALFVGQAALAINLAGQLLIITGVGILTENITGTAIATILVQIGLIFAYPDYLQRVISPLIILGALVMILVGDYELNEAIHGLIFLWGLFALMLHIFDTKFVTLKLSQLSQPISWGVILGLMGLLLPSTQPPDMEEIIHYWWLSTGGLTGLLIALVILIWFDYRNELNSVSIVVSIIGILLLAILTWSAPGIVGACFIILMGFWRGNKILTGLAVPFLAIFIGSFYYHLDLTLLTKSLMLVGSGALAFAMRLILRQLETNQ
jgi:uncharacterized membrane protein